MDQEIVSNNGEPSNEELEAAKASENGSKGENSDEEPVIDVSGKNWEVSLFDCCEDNIKGLYLYKNAFNLIPRSLGGLKRLKTLKFFANEINLFPSETGDLVELECLQVKISSPRLSGVHLHKLKALKELELFKVPPRPSTFPVLGEISNLKCLTKLSLCHFSVRYLPPEIGCLIKLEYLDLSFNKLKGLPDEITSLYALKSLKVANNKLVKLPLGLSCLEKLENLDLSNNRLTSLGNLKLTSMHALQKLNLQYNKLLDCCQIPSWICCNLEGNGKDTSDDEYISSLIEVDVFDAATEKVDGHLSCNGSLNTSSSLLSEASSNGRCSAARRMRKGWKRRDYFQQRARQERLNSSRKLRAENHDEIITMKVSAKREPFKLSAVTSESLAESGLESVNDLDDDDDKQILAGDNSHILLNHAENDKHSSSKGYYEDCSCIPVDSVGVSKDCDYESQEHNASSASSLNRIQEQEYDSSSEASKNIPKSKRHSDRDLDNPKPSKSRRPVNSHSNLSCKYSNESFCSTDDRLPDGFYDAGRDRPFMPLQNYEQSLCLDSREVILVDRETDEELDAIALSAQALMSRLKQSSGLIEEREQLAVDDLNASLLALFVSSHFGGSDRSATIERARKSVAGSNYQKPFVCTCPTGNSIYNEASTKQILCTEVNFDFMNQCEKSLRFIKESRNSNIVPLGTLQFGVCRHRAVLMKYLCDRMDPPIPCELVRGYLDFMPHAWNIILVRRGDSLVRMVVDACRPTDIREETDREYFCRYIPLSRVHVPPKNGINLSSGSPFPSLSSCDVIENAVSSSIIRCKFGSVEAVAKVRTLEACEASAEEMKNFEYACIGEIRMLGALTNHSCIVEIYGHQISSKWVPLNGNKEHRLLQSAILLEYVKGGSLKSHVVKLSKGGEKRVSVKLALFIAKDVACALAELHSKHIIHRDIKSENILIDLDSKRADGTPVVKLCDFDRAVPLRSLLHKCCIAHLGTPPPDVCVGTPRWMAPEVLRAMHGRNIYGLEVDIWSYGCLLLELLTLQVPYAGLSESEIHDLLQIGERPRLTDDLEELRPLNEPTATVSGAQIAESEAEEDTLRFLVDLFRRCTERNPIDRLTAKQLFDMLHAHAISFTASTS